jgi:hypothetical protein
MLQGLVLAGWATARQHAFGRGKSKVVNVRITEASRKVIAERISPRPQVLAPSSVPEFRPLTQRTCGGSSNPRGMSWGAAFLHGPTAALEAEAKKRLLAKSPLDVPWIEPEAIAPAVVFLASDEAYMVSGATYDVTGGDSANYTA